MSETLKQLKRVWDELGRTQKLMVGGITAVVFLSLLVAVLVGRSTEYLPLSSDLEIEDSQKLLARLEEWGISYEVSPDGSTIRVDRKRLKEARRLMLKEGLAAGMAQGRGYGGLTDIGISMTDDQRSVWMRVLQEQELAKTIRNYNRTVRKAKVSITPPVRRSFKRGDEAAKAVVNIQNEPGRFLDAGQVQAIQIMVANAVKGLDQAHVAVIDSSGHNLAMGSELASQTDLYTLAKRTREAAIQEKLASALAAVVGPDDVKVRVSIDLDRERLDSTTKEIDKGSKAVTRERTESSNNSRTRPQGQPSTAQKPGGGRSGDSKMEKNETDYEYSTTVTRRTKESGAIQRMSVAVWINSDPNDAELNREPMRARLEEVARAAVGIDPGRKDTFALHLVHFRAPAAPEPVPEVSLLDNPKTFEWAQWGLAALLSLGVLLWFLRTARKARASLRAVLNESQDLAAQDAENDEPEEEPAPPDPAEEIIGVVDSNPEAVGRLLRNWMYEAVN